MFHFFLTFLLSCFAISFALSPFLFLRPLSASRLRTRKKSYGPGGKSPAVRA